MKFRRLKIFLLIIAAADICLAAGAGAVWKRYYGGACQLWPRQAHPVSFDGPTEKPKVAALTFDDGPNVKYTARLLDGLKERDVKATFFLIGECIEGSEDIVKRMDEEGHLIGVHCLHHTDLTKEELKEANRQLEETRKRIYEVTGKKPEYVRPPYGKWSDTLRESVDMIPVFWNVDSVDWKLKNTRGIVKKVIKDTEDGDIILMHDEFSTSVDAALQIIDNLHAKGYTFVTVDELSVD